jgi:hypothetical protein
VRNYEYKKSGHKRDHEYEPTVYTPMQAKELWVVGEKQRQKILQEKKIKDLKETAIRGLEPHLDNLNDVRFLCPQCLMAACK